MDIEAKVSVYIKFMVNLLKLKPKADETITIVAIDRIKQKSLRSTRLVTVKVID